MSLDKWLPSKEKIERWIEEDKKGYDILIAGVGRRYNKEKIQTGNQFERFYYSIKQGLLDNFSDSYQRAEGL